LALNKRKVLDAARKFAQKGAKQKALKEYNKLVQVDPRDAKLLLEVGDAYRRWGQVEEAIAQYNKVANQYKQDGFDARAVAVLKQILNLDPKYHVAHVSLAELYQRMGLESDAIASLQTAADTCYKEGNRKEALELLRKMASLDPTNTTSRLKVADLLKQEGLEDEAVAEYEEVANELGRQGATEQVAVVQERILEIRPDRSDLLQALAQSLCDMGRPERAEPFALRAVESAPEPETYELLCGVYKALNNDARLAEVTRDLAGAYRARGDDERAREVMQRLPSTEIGADRSAVDESLLSEDELLEDDDFLVGGEDEEFTLEDEIGPATRAPDIAAEEDALESEPESEEASLPEGDPDQLFAEASVYLRYGKRDQAIANLKAILIQGPDHRGALEKLGEAHAEAGDEGQAVACWTRAAESARAEDDAAAFGVLRDRIAGLDAAAAEGIEPMAAPADDAAIGQDESEFELELDDEDEPPAAEAEEEHGLDLDIDLDVDVDVDAGGASEEAEVEVDEGFEIDVDDEEESFLADAGTDTSEVEIALDDDEADEDDFELDIDVDDGLADDASDEGAAELDVPVELDDGPAASFGATGGQSTTTAAQIQEDLEEAEFYIQQGLSDEAEAIYRRVLDMAPNHPSALLKLGELAAARGDDPGAVTDSGLDAAPAEEAAAQDLSDDQGLELDISDDAEIGVDDVDGIDFGSDEEDSDEPDASVDIGLDEDAGIDLGAEVDVSDDDATDDGLDVAEEFGLDLADDDSELSLDDGDAAGKDHAAERDPVAAHAEAGEDSTQVEAVDSTVDPAPPFEREPLVPAEEVAAVSQSDETQPYAPEEEAAEPLAAAADDDATFDLGEALADVFEDQNATSASGVDPNETSAVLSHVEDGFESIFADFKKGVSATLGAGDYETRFDLGIAYREMGLYDDGIGEFRICLDSPNHRFQSLSMMGLCAFDLGRYDDAINHFEQALASDGLSVEQQAGVNFDLGRAHVGAGDTDRARSAFERVSELDPELPGVSEQLDALASGGAEAALELKTDSDDGWESFDDIMGGGDDADAPVEVAPEPEPESFESFDDVITDAEAIVDAEVIEEVEPEPEPASPADSASSRRPRKKKISFV
jgi:tetratricopeptide (TPR) repeat protein